jgi:hypothetical protein
MEVGSLCLSLLRPRACGPGIILIGVCAGFFYFQTGAGLDKMLHELRLKVHTEKSVLDGAKSMRAQVSNPQTVAQLDSTIHEIEKRISYLEQEFRRLQVVKIQGGLSSPSAEGRGMAAATSGGASAVDGSTSTLVDDVAPAQVPALGTRSSILSLPSSHPQRRLGRVC